MGGKASRFGKTGGALPERSGPSSEEPEKAVMHYPFEYIESKLLVRRSLALFGGEDSPEPAGDHASDRADTDAGGSHTRAVRYRFRGICIHPVFRSLCGQRKRGIRGAHVPFCHIPFSLYSGGECWHSAITGGIKKEKSVRLRSGRSVFQIIEDFFGKKEKDTFQVACKFFGSGFIFLGQPADQGGNQPVIEEIQ